MPNSDLKVFNYCLGFLDLLGQGDELKNQEIIPEFKNDAEKEKFTSTIKNTVGAIRNLQKRATEMVEASEEYTKNSPLGANIPAHQRQAWDEMSVSKLQRQSWSDGLVYFSNMGDAEVKCRVNSIYEIMVMCGALYFQGLAIKQPIRGGIDIAWGVELAPGEIYGAVVARAYDLESRVAQYPRIVVSDRIVNFLQLATQQAQDNVFSIMDRGLADICLSMLAKDLDGVWIIHVLGDGFRKTITTDQHDSLYDHSLKFIVSQLELFRQTKNTKLAIRYSLLLTYFAEHPAGDSSIQ